jgi:hypothetical protein
MQRLPEPPEWGKDKITEFLDTVRGNNYATFVQLKHLFSRLIDIDEIFRTAIDSMNYSRKWFELLFFLKAHASYLASVGLSSGTQISEAYMVLRGVLESSLYGYYIHKNPKLADTWLRRHDSRKAKDIVRNEFQIRKMMNSLKAHNPKLGNVLEELYERTIDFGAHPNERSLTALLKQDKKGDEIEFKLKYITDDPILIKVCLKSTAQIGVLSLKILELVIPERFQLTGLDRKLERVSKGL